MRSTTGIFEKEHHRSQSGLANRKNKDSPIENKIQGKQVYDLPSTSSFKLHLKDIKEELESQTFQPLVIDKSKISSKAYGIIKAYSANSHSGPLLNYN